MALALPNFAVFDVHSDGAVDTRWKKWLARFRNFLLALAVDNAKRQRAFLLHYVGESVNEIFETLPDTDAGEDENPFEKAVTALTNYFTPKKNREYEEYVFRKAKQESDENISAFHTRLRRLAMTCEFADTDREIKTQIVQNRLSHKLRMKALQSPDLTLTQLQDAGKAMEMSKSQAENIEGKQDVNKLSRTNARRPWKPNKDGRMMTGSQTTGIHATGIMHSAEVASVGTVGTGTHIREEKLPALLMENLAVGVENKTTLRLYADPKILTREMSSTIENGTFKT